jgi:glucose/arabinose dehydrogenase
MRAQRIVVAGLTALTLVVSSAAVALATHDDVIPEPIPASDVAVGFDTVADGFTTPLWGINAPGDPSRIYIADQVGKVWAIKVDPETGKSVPDRLLFLDVGVDGLDLLVPLGAFGPGTFDERGLLGLAFHPLYRSNGLVYTYTSEPAEGPLDFSTLPDGVPANHHSVIREWHVSRPNRGEATVDPASSRVLLRIAEPQFNHNAGALVFGRDRMLYIAVGDGGAADDQGLGHAPGGNGQDLSAGNVLGKILRIDPQGTDSANGQYGIPGDNPFVGSDAADEIYAYGFRNPFRISVDQHRGRIHVADVGQNDIEEIDVLVRGGNYGWPVKEGSFLFDMNGSDPGFTTDLSPGVPPGMIDPIAEYDHDEGISVTGGFVYRGPALRELRGSYVFGDFTRSFAGPQGRVFHLATDGAIAELGEPGMFVTGLAQNKRGEMYVLGTQNVAPVGTTGTISRIVPSGG